MKSVLIGLSLVASFNCWAISVGNAEYYKPVDYFKTNNSKALKKAMEAVVFFPKRGTGVLIDSSGLVVTAAHVIAHVAIGATKKCQKLGMYLKHRDGEKEEKLECAEVLHYDYTGDFALIRIKTSKKLPSVKLAQVDRDEHLSQNLIIMGHPGANHWNKSKMVISNGPIILSDYASKEISHFLHLVSTEGGHSGSPVFTNKGKLLGIHFRGIPNYGPGVMAKIDGEQKRVYRFNVALYPHEPLIELGYGNLVP